MDRMSSAPRSEEMLLQEDWADYRVPIAVRRTDVRLEGSNVEVGWHGAVDVEDRLDDRGIDERSIGHIRGIAGWVHETRKTFMIKSPRWSLSTAMRRRFGFSKGRGVSLRRAAQASSLISALRVVLS